MSGPHRYDPAKLARLLSDERKATLDPEVYLRRSGLKSGETFVDIGSGPGFFTMPASLIVGPAGKVFAIDAQDEMCEALRRRNPLPNVSVIKSDGASMPIDDTIADVALIAFVLHEVDDKGACLKEVFRVLKNMARVLVLDWQKIFEEKGPPIEERLSVEESASLLKSAGFDISATNSIGTSFYSIIGIKKSA